MINVLLKAHQANFKLVVCLLLLVVLPVFSQSTIGINYSLTPGGKLETVFDNYGNKYSLSDISIAPKKDIKGDRILTSSLLCTSGIFNLYFEQGSGMESTTNSIEIARRTVVCQVFQDLSNFINTPLHNDNIATKVNIWIRNIRQIPKTDLNLLALGTGFYSVPVVPTAVNGGIADNEIWKTIHTGVDSFTNTTKTIIINNSAELSFYHGMLAFNFAINNWNTNLSTTTTTLNDLYSITLREATHALGFASLIDVTGGSVFGTGYNYYSRYDTFLVDYNGKKLITTNASSPLYNYNFTTSSAVLYPGCSAPSFIATTASNSSNCATAVGFKGSNVTTIAVYTPSCFEKGSSLSHFEDQCYTSTTAGATNGNDAYFVMSNSTAEGIVKRYLKPEERNALSDLGYSLTTTYGGIAAASSVNYGTTISQGIKIAGVNDGISSTDYLFKGVANAPILITGLLNNDVSYDSSFATSSLSNVRFKLLEDVYDATAIITTTGNNQLATITFRSAVEGVHLLRYTPYNIATEQFGNITYVYV